METHKKYARPKKMFWDGREEITFIQGCECDNRRGPAGGVCGNCGYAIADKDGK